MLIAEVIKEVCQFEHLGSEYLFVQHRQQSKQDGIRLIQILDAWYV
jgi:hypothetical protein